MGIDPGREIDERFGGVRKHLPRRGQIAAVRERLERRSGRVPVWDRMSIAITLLALLIEATLGYPDRVLRAIGHPVMWLGRMIGLARRDAQPRHEQRAAGAGRRGSSRPS